MEKNELITKIEHAREVLRAQKEKYYSTHFYEFSRDVLGWPDIYEPLHRRVCDFVQDNVDKKKLLILLPRGSLKSSIITVGYTLWRICKNPNERVLIANATYPMAVSFLKQIKDHLSKNETLKDIYGDLTQDAEGWRENLITLAGNMDGTGYRGKEPTVSAYGMESNLVGSHFTFGIMDDMVNRDNINTREQLEKPINFFKDALDLIDPINGRKQILVIGTTWHLSDLYSWIEDEESGVGQDFAILKLPAYEGEWGKGKLLFPTRLGWKQLEELKRSQGSSHFNAQYLLNPVPREDALFKFDFKYYEETDLTGLDLNKFIAIDPALSDKKSADYSAMVCVGVDKNNTWYILDIWRDKVNPSRLIDQVFYWDEKWKPITIGMETVAFQKILQFSINDEMKKRNRFIPIKELTHHDKSKDERIRGLEPRYETGTVFHNKAIKETMDLEDELRRFPRGKNDDLIDALASILEISYPPRKRMERRTNRRTDYPA